LRAAGRHGEGRRGCELMHAFHRVSCDDFGLPYGSKTHASGKKRRDFNVLAGDGGALRCML
jgi:hypothetical protein